MENELLKELEEDVTKFLMTSSLNYVSKEMALQAEDIGERLYDAPIFAIGSAEDELWEQMKRKEAVGELFTTPKEWCSWAKTVISYFAPFSDFVVEGNKKDKVVVGNGWLYARVEGQNFLTT
ncbi:MAG: hypothetical protein KBS95_00530 [Alistipes sp.]|nr:hypothetical protein [Candidatus Alistipes equi]